MMFSPDIWLLTADLGYGLLDNHRDDFPDRYINLGASEQTMVGAAVGLALSGKIAVCYSITTFLLYRPFEWIRNYVNNEKIPVKLIGSGYMNDYAHDGFTHQPSKIELALVSMMFPKIHMYFPSRKEEIPEVLNQVLYNNEPSFLCLRR
jgi:transketolase